MSLIKGGSRLYGVLVDRGSSRGYLELVLDEAFTFLTVLNRSTMSEK